MRRRTTRTVAIATALLISLCALAPSASQNAYAARDWGGYMWKLEGKRIYTGENTGPWKVGIRAKADGSPGDTIQMGTTKSVSNSVSGNCGISKGKLNAAFQFNVNRTWSVNASKSYGLTKKKKGTWWAIQYKPVHRQYKVKARKYNYINGKWHMTSQTKWIFAKRFDHFAYRLVKAHPVN